MKIQTSGPSGEAVTISIKRNSVEISGDGDEILALKELENYKTLRSAKEYFPQDGVVYGGERYVDPTDEELLSRTREYLNIIGWEINDVSR